MRKHGLTLIVVVASIVAAPNRATGDEALASLPPDRLAERIRAELAFAEGLAPLHPDRKAEWGLLVEKARALVGSGEVDAQRVAEAEAVLAPVAAVAKTYTVHNVGHAHIDMNWMWPWQRRSPSPTTPSRPSCG